MNIGQVKYSYIYLIKPRWFLFSHQVRCWSRMSEIYTGNRFKYLLDISTNIDVVSWQWGVRVYRFDHQRSLHRMHWCFLTALGKAVSWINDLVFINKMFVIDQVLSSALRTVCKDEFLIFCLTFVIILGYLAIKMSRRSFQTFLSVCHQGILSLSSTLKIPPITTWAEEGRGGGDNMPSWGRREEGLTSLLQLSFTSQYLFKTISHSSHENQMLQKVNLHFICMAL